MIGKNGLEVEEKRTVSRTCIHADFLFFVVAVAGSDLLPDQHRVNPDQDQKERFVETA
jgi:hypothetical protein